MTQSKERKGGTIKFPSGEEVRLKGLSLSGDNSLKRDAPKIRGGRRRGRIVAAAELDSFLESERRLRGAMIENPEVVNAAVRRLSASMRGLGVSIADALRILKGGRE